MCVVNDIHMHYVQLYCIQFSSPYVKQCGRLIILAIISAVDNQHINPHATVIWQFICILGSHN